MEITGVTALGSGIGRYVDADYPHGFVVFVPLTAIGDRISCRIVKVEKAWAYGKMEELLVPSPHRTEDVRCEAFGKCGGCAWQHVKYDCELAYKQQHVADCLSRIGGIPNVDTLLQPIVGSACIEGYRNKAQYPVVEEEGRPLIGFYAPRSHRLIEQRDCALQPKVFRVILDKISQWIVSSGVSLYNERTHTGLLRHIYLRIAEATGEIMTCLVCTSGKIPQSEALVRSLREVEGMTSVMVNLNRRDTNVVLGDSEFTLWGQSYITDVLCGIRVRLSPRSFYQVNHCQAEVLYTLAREAAALTGTETVWDLYCGTGTIGLSMAADAKQIIGAEIVEAAVEDAVRNAAENGIQNARFLCADAGKAAQTLEKEGIRPEVVIVDPPRKGCSQEVLNAICRLFPQRVVYVSCDPATLARDIAYLSTQGYVLKKATPVDMFPRTAHVETVCLMSRKVY